ncbi:hypothetical protein [Microbacterium hatanonis]|uniref:Uncharacterized protein n=1 Tax=Microbacterium hatanonis TaxID=404366 RepID=A0A5C8I5M1_9MICO|nr:hypothetical protein [Microbacterium hatanonis]TXK13374.1 hypothetical protein FVP77_08210 [Microbacterium hatanonis]
MGALVFTTLFAAPAALAGVSALTVSYTPFQWAIIGFLVLSAALSAAGEIWEVRRLRRDDDGR